MRTTLDIDEKLLQDASRLANGKTKKAVVEEALREFTRKRRIEQLRKMAGTDAIDLNVEDLRRMRGK
jgi:Arc/MetJ family transcription regulator